jgi:hypothetical protein
MEGWEVPTHAHARKRGNAVPKEKFMFVRLTPIPKVMSNAQEIFCLHKAENMLKSWLWEEFLSKYGTTETFNCRLDFAWNCKIKTKIMEVSL